MIVQSGSGSVSLLEMETKIFKTGIRSKRESSNIGTPKAKAAILDGNLEIGAQVWRDHGYLTSLRHLSRSGTVTNLNIFRKTYSKLNQELGKRER